MAKGSNKKKKQIASNPSPEPTKKVSSPINPFPTKPTVSFDFSYKDWLKSVAVKGFTNYHHNQDTMLKSIAEIFNLLLPTVIEEWETEIRKNPQGRKYQHCHTVDNKKLPLIEDVLTRIHGDKISDITSEYSCWQLGIRGAARLIVIHDSERNILFPMFVDFNHLLHTSVKFNQHSYQDYSKCIIEDFSK